MSVTIDVTYETPDVIDESNRIYQQVTDLLQSVYGGLTVTDEVERRFVADVTQIIKQFPRYDIDNCVIRVDRSSGIPWIELVIEHPSLAYDRAMGVIK